MENAHLMPFKLDKDAYLVANFGAMVSYERNIFKDWLTAKIVQAWYTDCAVQPAGFTHIG